jgi:hypothetical protein
MTVWQEAFSRPWEFLRDYLPEIVVGGGWAPFLYHRYLFRDSKREPIFTRDIDLMVGPKVPVNGRSIIFTSMAEMPMT